MPITFESIKDPYGLKEGIGTLSSALMQRGMEKRQNEQQIEKEKRAQEYQLGQEQRAMEQQKNVSGLLGESLKKHLPQEGQPFTQEKAMQFMQDALSQGVPMSEILNSMKAMQVGQPKPGAMTQFGKEIAKSNVGFLKTTQESGRKAKEMLAGWDDLDKAITSPDRYNNFVSRTAKTIPGASTLFSAEDQTISAYGKEIIANFTNMKGLRLTDAKLRWLEGIAPAPWKTPEANMESSAYFKRIAEIQNAYGEVSSNLANAYAEAGLELPQNFEKLVDDAVKPLSEEIDTLYKNRSKIETATATPGSTMNKMPSAKGNEGMLIEDDKGNRYRSSGTRWVKEK